MFSVDFTFTRILDEILHSEVILKTHVMLRHYKDRGFSHHNLATALPNNTKMYIELFV
jgi:hypothetical protein